MFESLPDLASLAAADDATVVAAIESGARDEAASAAWRLAAIAELMDRRCREDDEDPRSLWACDNWDSAAAEVAAALGISHRRASNQMHLARGLRERLPKTAALLANGAISAPTASTIAWRTHLVDDEKAMAAIDADIAKSASDWGPLSESLLNQSIDAVLEEHDPDARRQFHNAALGRDVQFGKPEDSTGTASVWGRLYNTDAVLLDRRLTAITRTLCRDDPRTIGERRSDAVGALAAGVEGLACRCGKPECPNTSADSRAGAVVIHVVADEQAVHAARAEQVTNSKQASSAQQEPSADQSVGDDQAVGGEQAPAAQQPADAEQAISSGQVADAEQVASAEQPRKKYRAALIRGGGVVPTPLLAELIRSGAKISPLRKPNAVDEANYRPSAKLDAFIRARDLTCRFPGCNAPAEYCDVDHTVAHPDGTTHPSNLKCLCRKHHLLKTFWRGADGWTDQQHPDGTITWTSPSGRTYTTYPGSRILFPQWDITTTPAPPPNAAPSTSVNRGLMMPQRRRTRAADQRQRKKAERALNLAAALSQRAPEDCRTRLRHPTGG